MLTGMELYGNVCVCEIWERREDEVRVVRVRVGER